MVKFLFVRGKPENTELTKTMFSDFELLAPKTASGRASWRSRRPWVRLLALKTGLLAPRRSLHGVPGALDRPPGAQDSLRTGLLALQTAPKTGPPGAQAWRSKRAWRPDGLCTELLALWTGLLAPKTASRRASWRFWRQRRPPDGPPGPGCPPPGT